MTYDTAADTSTKDAVLILEDGKTVNENRFAKLAGAEFTDDAAVCKKAKRLIICHDLTKFIIMLVIFLLTLAGAIFMAVIFFGGISETDAQTHDRHNMLMAENAYYAIGAVAPFVVIFIFVARPLFRFIYTAVTVIKSRVRVCRAAVTDVSGNDFLLGQVKVRSGSAAVRKGQQVCCAFVRWGENSPESDFYYLPDLDK